MPTHRRARLALSITLVAGIVVGLLNSNPRAIEAAWSELLFSSVVLVLMLLFGGVVLSSLRLKLITSDLGYRLSFRDAAMTLSAGQLAGSVFFQFAGQLIGRSAVLSRKGIPAAATVVISGYERVIALSVSLLLAGFGALYLFGTLSINMQAGGLSLVKLALGLIVAIVAGALFAWGRAIANVIRSVTLELLSRLLRSFAISFAIQATTLAAYVALERALAPHIGVTSLAAASCIVMLAASLPISFGGWGLRELSAVVALQAIGLSAASALLTALLIGFLSLVVIAGTAVLVMLGRDTKGASQNSVSATPTPDYTSVLDWSLPLVAATAVFFQIYIPAGGSPLSVNLADPVVVIAAVLFGLRYSGKNWPTWLFPHTATYVAAATAVIFASLLHGWASFGWTDWAFVNKGLGWLILLCYGATGALIVFRAQLGGFELLLRTFAATGASIACIDVGSTVLSQMGISVFSGFAEYRIFGFSQNPNAFAFMLLLVLAAAIVLQARPAVRIGLMIVALLGIWFAGSRAGFIAAPIVLGAALIMGVALRPLLIAVGATVAFIAGVAGLSWLLPLLGQVSEAGRVFVLIRQDDSVATYQHLQTIEQGLAMFMAHPVFGAGLGAYMNGQILTMGTPLVIHSSAVWLLAETGIIGFSVFLAAAYSLCTVAIRRRGEPAALLLLLMLCALAIMSFAHELMYQRAFWILLGAVLAVPAGTFWRLEKD
jgi:O-antigen ligase